ncbi:MAG: threonine/serine exporter family protein [Clostridiales bacterium]|nr:threonine/serine exporter family protein [Clostridiales bacterium]
MSFGMEKRALDAAMLAGDIMLSNGAETYRVEDTMRRMLKAVGYPEAEAFVTATGIIGSLGDNGSSTRVKRVKSRTNNMEKIARVNSLSRRLSEGTADLEGAERELALIRVLPGYGLKLRTLMAAVSCFSFCYLCGGSWIDCVASMLVATPVYLFYDLISKKTTGFLVNATCGAMIATLGILAVKAGMGRDSGNIIIGAIMPFVPGVAMTNGLRDIAEGDFLSGTSRMMEALLTGGALAFGAGAVIKVWMAAGGAAI